MVIDVFIDRATDSGIGKGHALIGPISYVIVVFTTIAIYNVIELTFIIWAAFKRHSGMYFWSFIVATYGILVYAIGFLLKAENPDSLTYLYVTFIAVGWVAMVTGQSLVLWSRLHLILRDRRKLNLILYMIITNAIILHVPILVMLYGSNSNAPDRWTRPYGIYEKVQVTIFFIQETIISSVYIFETVKLSRVLSAMQTKKRSQNLKHHLIIVNVIIILLDITIIVLEYANLYNVQTAYKALVYSVKLKMEFSILNRMVEMTTGKREADTSETSRAGGHGHRNSYGLERGSSAVSRPSVPRGPPSVCYRASVHGGESRQEDSRRGSSAPVSGDHDVLMTMEIDVRHEPRVMRDRLAASGLTTTEGKDEEDILSSNSSSGVDPTPMGS